MNRLALFSVAVLALAATPVSAQSGDISLPPAPAKDWATGKWIEVARSGDVVVYGWASRWSQGDGGANVGIVYSGHATHAYVKFTIDVTCSDGTTVTLPYSDIRDPESYKTEQDLKQNHGQSVQCGKAVGKTMRISGLSVNYD